MDWGRWLLTITIIHFIYSFVVFHKQFHTILAAPFNAVDGSSDQLVHTAAWFFLFGILMGSCGFAVSALQQAGGVPKSIGWSLLVLGIIGVIPMPLSGFWLVFPPAIGILLEKSTPLGNNKPKQG